jgi:hypothetical protein
MKKKKNIPKESVIKLISEGKTLKEIGVILDFNPSSLYTFCIKNNIQWNKIARGGQNIIDLSGKKFGSLTILCRDTAVKHKLAYWTCQCDCGNIVSARGADIRNNKIKTCGCRRSVLSKRNWKGVGYISKSLWQTIVRNAKNRKIEISITQDFANELLVKQNFKCSLTGTVLSTEIRKTTASLDRIDSLKGYTEDNVQWVHKDINMLKNKYSIDKFLDMCKQVVEYDNFKRSHN